MLRITDREPRETDGFTFLEVLISLVILTIVAGVLLDSHTSILRTEDRIRSVVESRIRVSQIAARSWMGFSPAEILVDVPNGWEISVMPVEEDDGTNSVMWQEWTISPSNRPSQRTVFYMKLNR